MRRLGFGSEPSLVGWFFSNHLIVMCDACSH